jgi:hypothetical protein
MELRGTLREVEDRLPSGFHDAYLEAVKLDCVSNAATMELDLDVGDPDAATKEEREARRKATLFLRGLVYFAIEPPDPRYEYSQGNGLWVDAGDAAGESNPRAPRALRPLPEGASAHWFYVSSWNSFIHVAAREAELQWRE